MVDQEEIHRKSLSDKVEDRREAVNQLFINFVNLPDSDVAWRDLHRLTFDKDSDIREESVKGLIVAIYCGSYEEASWHDLIRLFGDEDRNVRLRSWANIPVAYHYVPDKGASWHDLIHLISEWDLKVEEDLAEIGFIIGKAYSDVPDKDAAVQDLYRLIGDESSYIRRNAVLALSMAFPHVSDKETAWRHLIRHLTDENNRVAHEVVACLWDVFPHIPDKDVAWQDLYRLSYEKDIVARMNIALALGYFFSYVPDKRTAWEDIYPLTSDEDIEIRGVAAFILGIIYPHVPDKDAAWLGLHRLTDDENGKVREVAASAIGSAFSVVPDREAAWNDVVDLSNDHERDVRVTANHSLGRASIFKATETESEDDFRRDLESALQYFERSVSEAEHSNPSKFCLPFYRSFYALAFKNEDSEAEVRRFLAEAKEASEGSERKKYLLEAVENLSNALKETKSLRERGFEATKCDFNSYRKYCDRASELLNETEEIAPGATKIIKRGLPIIDQRIKDLLKEIIDKSYDICKAGNPLNAELNCRIQKHATSALEKTYNPMEVQKKVNQMLGDIDLWSDSILDLHLRGYTKKKLEEAKNEDIIGQLSIIQILQVATMSGKNNPKYVIEDRPWYKDRNYLIALVVAIITAIGVLMAI